MRAQSFSGKWVAPRVRGPRSHLIGQKLLYSANRKEPRFGHRVPHLDGSDWWTAVPPARSHWVHGVRGAARLVGSCFPSSALEKWG
jgi:hypothetical protein